MWPANRQKWHSGQIYRPNQWIRHRSISTHTIAVVVASRRKKIIVLVFPRALSLWFFALFALRLRLPCTSNATVNVCLGSVVRTSGWHLFVEDHSRNERLNSPTHPHCALFDHSSPPSLCFMLFSHIVHLFHFHVIDFVCLWNFGGVSLYMQCTMACL